jgi:hypothetical protein
MRTLTISQVFVAISITDFKFSPTTGTACTTEPRTSSAAIARSRQAILIKIVSRVSPYAQLSIANVAVGCGRETEEDAG